MRYVSVVFAVLTLFGSGLVVTSPGNSATIAVLKAQDNPIEMSEESVAAGRVIYSRFCRSCHGPEGKGDGLSAHADAMPANLVDDEWDHGGSDAEIFRSIREGIPPDYFMEPWEGRITDEDIWNTVNYLHDLYKRINQ